MPFRIRASVGAIPAAAVAVGGAWTDDGEAVAGPFERRAGIERSIEARRGDVGLPGGPAAEIGVQPPDGVQRWNCKL